MSRSGQSLSSGAALAFTTWTLAQVRLTPCTSTREQPSSRPAWRLVFRGSERHEAAGNLAGHPWGQRDGDGTGGVRETVRAMTPLRILFHVRVV